MTTMHRVHIVTVKNFIKCLNGRVVNQNRCTHTDAMSVYRPLTRPYADTCLSIMDFQRREHGYRQMKRHTDDCFIAGDSLLRNLENAI